MTVRTAAAAGRFYPAEAEPLRGLVLGFLAGTPGPPADGERPRALIVPHAGYPFSGPIAASAYAWLVPWSRGIDRVILLGTCHTPGVRGLAVTQAEGFETPLGLVPVDRDGVEACRRHRRVQVDERAQARDHALEVQLPFLQVILEEFAIVPLLVGQVDGLEVADLLEDLAEDDRTLIVVSSDLSHYHPHDEAARLDRAAADAIEALDADRLGPRSACGRNAIAGLLELARRRRLCVRCLDLRSSGDTAGPRERVVGYGAWAFLPDAQAREISARRLADRTR
jgi:AmmeMemoRadiSam system protein B